MSLEEELSREWYIAFYKNVFPRIMLAKWKLMGKASYESEWLVEKLQQLLIVFSGPRRLFELPGDGLADGQKEELWINQIQHFEDMDSELYCQMHSLLPRHADYYADMIFSHSVFFCDSPDSLAGVLRSDRLDAIRPYCLKGGEGQFRWEDATAPN
eukprot:GHVS01022586.1.p1 GENE.GHVS01022586.1~~GHVS01022586.1.p1  ORF type:complete len:156 (+),score=8.26 GHVS01022586.1:167-634(+)